MTRTTFISKTHWLKSILVVFSMFSILLSIIASGCKTAGNVYSPEEWCDLFKKAGGWTPLPFPDSKYRPGAIIKVDEEGIRWIDNLEACHYPIVEFEESSYIPSITFEKAWAFGANVLLNYKGVSAGPSFDKISKVRMEIQDHGADAFRIVKLRVWLENPDNRRSVSPACMDELMKPDRYLVTEAFRVSKGKYELKDKSGATIKLEAPVLKDLLQFQPDVAYEVNTDGSLVIEQPAYFAVRKAVRVGDNFEVLGSSAEDSAIADGQIEKLFLKTTKVD